VWKFLFEVWDSHSFEYEDFLLMACNILYSGENLLEFREKYCFHFQSRTSLKTARDKHPKDIKKTRYGLFRRLILETEANTSIRRKDWVRHMSYIRYKHKNTTSNEAKQYKGPGQSKILCNCTKSWVVTEYDGISLTYPKRYIQAMSSDKPG